MTKPARGVIIAATVSALLAAAPAAAFPQLAAPSVQSHAPGPGGLAVPDVAVPAVVGPDFFNPAANERSAPRPPASGDGRPPLTSEELMMEAVADGATWCLRGATFAVLFSAAFSVPGMLTGLGTSYGTARAASAAMAGCGMAMTWRALARTLAYLDGVLHPLAVPPETAPVRPLGKRRPMIETAG